MKPWRVTCENCPELGECDGISKPVSYLSEEDAKKDKQCPMQEVRQDNWPCLKC